MNPVVVSASPQAGLTQDKSLQTNDVRRLCKVTFKVRAYLHPGQHVRVLGSHSNLGWDHDHGLVLSAPEPDGASVPEWTGEAYLPTNSTIEYKYVVCEENTFCYSLSSTRRLFSSLEPLVVDGGEFCLNAKYEKIQTGNFGHQLKVQIEIPPNTATQAGQPQLGVTFYEPQQLSEVSISTHDRSSKVIEAAVLSKQFHEVSSFHMVKTTDARSLHFAVKSTSGSVGKAVVLVSQLSASHHGILTVPLLDAEFAVIGELVFRYLVVAPFAHPHIVHSPTPKSRMAMPTPTSSSTLLIGHRGTGAEGSRKLVEGKVRSHIKENTVLSFTTAGALGAQLVEFDVHLTSDLVPVIYHDFLTHTQESDMPIHSMTYERFCKMGKRVVSRSTSLEDIKKRPLLSDTSSSMAIHDSYPTLRETLEKVPPNIGFNVEIKYPVEDEIVKHNLRPVNRNIYLDCILWEIYEHAKDRFIVFSSFDPEICLMLAAKQPHYPVFFLTQLGTVIRSDPRSNSVEASIEFAKSADLAGLVCPAKYLVSNPDVITKIKSSGLRLCTWGAENNDPKHVHLQKKMGVDGIIADHIGHIAKHWGMESHA